MVVLNRIYTRTGDDGTTALGSGERRKKYDLRVSAYGTLDEVNAVLGLARLYTGADRALDAALARIQNDLFDVEADLCLAAKGPGGARMTITDTQVQWLEQQIDQLNADLAPLRSLHPAGRKFRRGPSAPRAHRLPPRRAADGRAQRPVERRGHAGGAQIRQPPLGFSVRGRAARQRQGRVATCCGSRARTGDRDNP